ncbi:MAG: DUF1592 domain-containing protein, partial [Verrucomicrobiae bacterium]|nr:DUF1592 domain-containing protein [Verrucomicrobiae bacterium]
MPDSARMEKFVTALLILLCTSIVRGQDVDPRPFIEEHCLKCHGEKKQKGDRRFDSLTVDFEDRETAWAWEEILDMLNLGDMPPEEEPQPESEEISQVVSWITEKLDHSILVREAREVVRLRRMNRFEYRNTIRDLLGLHMESFDPTESFPADERMEGFENIGGTLVLSDYLLERYLEAAAQVVEKAVDFGPPVEPVSDYLKPDDFTDRTFHFRPQIWFTINVDGKYIDVGHGDAKSDRLYARRFKGAPADGYYTIRLTAEGVNRINRYNPELLRYDPDEPIKMQLIATNPEVAYPGRNQNNSDRILATVPLADNEVKTYEFRVWLDKGFVPVVRYPNGPQPFKQVLTRITERHHLDVVPSNWRDGVAAQPSENQTVYLSDVYEGPRIRFYGMDIHGPENTEGPSSIHAALFGHEIASPEQIDPGRVVQHFGSRAFRRPLREDECERYVHFFNRQVEVGETRENALKTLVTALLASPNFIYIEAPVEDGIEQLAKDQPENLDQFALASRLSYFLWSSMPDKALFDAAAAGSLSDPSELKKQALRLMTDPRARGFTEQFTDSWLQLNKLGEMPPDTGKFEVYHVRNLQPLMKEETRQYFAYMLSENRPLTEFIQSDYTFLNRYLADLYGLEGVSGDGFRRVRFADTSKRGGILGHASILTATSNGVETSPVVRGIWILENILGTPPPPPPDDVPPIDPDVRGAKSIRDILTKHRESATCHDCHQKIDPLGFALENYDPIGAWRTHYTQGKKRGPVIDAS